MEWTFLVNGIVNLCIFGCLLYFSMKNLKDENLKKINFINILLSISFLINALFSFLWSFEIIDFLLNDFNLIAVSLFIMTTILLIKMFSNIIKNRNLYFFLLLYFSGFVLLFIHINPITFFLIVSNLILLLGLLPIISINEFKHISFIGMIFILVSSIFYLIPLIELNIISNLFFGIFLCFLYKTIEKNKNCFNSKEKFCEEHSIIFDFLKYFIFIIVLTNFIFLATVTTHELGHFIPAGFIGCDYSKIVYEGGLPHTEILCQNNNPINLLIAILGGVLLPIIMGILFFFVGGKFMKEIGLMIFGFNLIISYKDLIDIGLTSGLSLFLTVIGFVFVIFAIGMLAGSRVEERNFIYFTEGDKSFYRGKNKK